MLAVAWSGLASAQAVSAMLQLPAGAAPVVRIRWPDTALGPRDAARLVAIADASGHPVPFAFVVAPEDAGRASRPLWLLLRADRPDPLTITVDNTPVAGSMPPLEWNDVVDDRAMTLDRLPLATVPAQSWGSIVAKLADVQADQDQTYASWRNGALLAAAVALVLVGAAVRVLSRARKGRRENVGRL